MQQKIGSLNTLVNKLNALNAKHNIAVHNIKDAMRKSFTAEMAKPYFRAAISRLNESLENSKNLTQTDDEFYHSYVNFNASSIIDNTDAIHQELLTEYLSDYGICIDFKYDTASTSIGPCILVDDESGAVYDQESNKCILSKKDYGSFTEFRAKVNNWMEKSGHFPSVLVVDRHGNAKYMNIN